MRQGFEKYFSPGKSISQNVASLNILVNEMINLLYYKHWTDKRKYFQMSFLLGSVSIFGFVETHKSKTLSLVVVSAIYRPKQMCHIDSSSIKIVTPCIRIIIHDSNVLKRSKKAGVIFELIR